jgi:hypothetical protein
MEQNKKKLSEGILFSLVDNFFKSLQKDAGDQFYNKVKNTDLHPEVKKAMKNIVDDQKALKAALKKYHVD